MKIAVNTNTFQVTFFPALIAASTSFCEIASTLIRPVNKLVQGFSRCQLDPYMKEIILLHAIRLSESIN